MDKVKSSGTMRSVRRTFQLLEYFAQHQRPMSPSQVATALDAPLSSTVDLLKCLSSLGYVAYDSRSRNYYPTLRVGLLGDWLTKTPLDHTSYQHVIRDLRDKTRETVGVFWQNDTQMMCVAALQGMHSITVSLNPGDTLQMFGSAVGTALLAEWTDSEIASVYERHVKRSGAVAAVPPLDACLQDVGEARRLNYAAGYDLVTEGLGAVATACPSSAGGWMVFSITGVSARIRKRERAFADLLVGSLRAAQD